jgi:hypothetical protein
MESTQPPVSEVDIATDKNNQDEEIKTNSEVVSLDDPEERELSQLSEKQIDVRIDYHHRLYRLTGN